MNGWDVFTWFNAAVLTVGTVLIFIFFLRDAAKVFDREGRSDE